MEVFKYLVANGDIEEKICVGEGKKMHTLRSFGFLLFAFGANDRWSSFGGRLFGEMLEAVGSFEISGSFPFW